jgi:hypothetical protein
VGVIVGVGVLVGVGVGVLVGVGEGLLIGSGLTIFGGTAREYAYVPTVKSEVTAKTARSPNIYSFYQK